MDARRPWTVVLLLALPLLLSPAAAQPAFGPGGHYIEDALVVAPGETFVLGPGTSLTGPGSLEVWGRLEVRGEPGRLAQVALPIRLRGDAAHVVAHARFWGVNGTAVSLENGTLRLDRVLFEAGGVGLDLAGPVSAEGADVTFLGLAEAGLSVGPEARAELSRALFEDNGEGARVRAGGALLLSDARAKGNRAHVLADVAPPGPEGPRVVLRDADLGATAQGSEGGLRLRAASEEENASVSAPGVLVAGGRLHDAALAVNASGRGLRVRIEGASIEDNVVGVALAQATAELKDVRLGNVRDLDAPSSLLLLENVTYVPRPQADAAAGGAPAPVPWPWYVPWLAMLGVALVAGAILWTSPWTPYAWRARTRRRPPPQPHAPAWRSPLAPPPPAPPEAPPMDDAEEAPGPAAPPPVVAPGDLGAQERRILADILAHPDTAQAAVGERLGLSRQAVHYHVKKLEAKGLIRKTTKGRETQCRAEPGAAAALGPAEARAGEP